MLDYCITTIGWVAAAHLIHIFLRNTGGGTIDEMNRVFLTVPEIAV
jgi:hypothetical protein